MPAKEFVRTLVSCALTTACGSVAYAQATCPSANDLDQGIALIRSEPFYSNVMTLTNDGLAEARVMVRDGEPEEVSSTYSHALTVTGRIGANGTLALVYDDDTSALDRLIELGTWSTSVTLFVDGVPQNTGVSTATYLGTTELTLGDCVYETWQVRSSLALDGRAPILQDRYFAPSLGLAIGTVSLDGDGNPISGVIFDRIEVR